MSKKYLTYLLKKHQKLIFVEFSILAGLIAYLILVNGNVYNGMFSYNMHNPGGAAYYLMHSVLKYFFVINAVVVPIYLHSKLYKQEGSDLYNALAMKREKRLFSEMVFGWIVVSLPAIVLVVVSKITGFMSDPFMFTFGIKYLVAFTVLYVVNHYLLVKCNNLFDAILIVVLVTLIFGIFPSIIQSFISGNLPGGGTPHIYDGVTMSPVYLVLCCLSPTYMMTEIFSLQSYAFKINPILTIILLVQLASIVIITLLTLIAYKNKKTENYGGITTSRAVYPLMSFVFCMMILTNFFTNDYSNITIFITILVTFVIYLGFQFIANRKIKCKSSYLISFVVLLCCVYTFRLISVSSDGFNSINRSYGDDKNIAMEITYMQMQGGVSLYEVYRLDTISIADEKLFNDFKHLQNRINEQFKQKNRWWPKQRNTEEIGEVTIAYFTKEEEKTYQNYTSYYYYIDFEQWVDIKELMDKHGFEKSYD